jgi:acyl-CoA synthetase (NDP forming)
MTNLSALLSPQSVAVIGATNDPHILRGRTLKVMLGHAYAGRIYPVSRSHSEVQGLKAYPSIDELPEKVDLAVLIIPAEFVCDELERCGRAGVKAALILSSGFAEQVGDQGTAQQARLREIAARHNMIVCGPNTEGFANTAAGLCPTFSPAVDTLDVPLFPAWRNSGHVAVIGQSGGMSFAFFDRGRPKEIPFSYIVTTGNEASLEVFDVVDYLLDEGRTEVFLLFIENIKNATTFRRVADKALRAGKPIIAVKIGHSDAGQRAAASHTAALAGTYETYKAMLRYYSIIEGADSEEMVDLAAAFSIYRKRLPAGTRVGIGTASGGGGGWMADACVAEGLQVPTLDAASRAAIDKHLPAYGTSQNPVDGTAQAIRQIGYSELARLIATSDCIDSVVMVVSARSAETLAKERINLTRVASECAKPIFMWSYTNPCAESVRILSEAGYPLFTNMRNCARAVAALTAYGAERSRYLCNSSSFSVDERRLARVRHALTTSVLCEYQVAPLLSEYGIETIASQLAKTADEAVAVAATMGAPVALKVQSPDILHKTDVGAVALHLRDADAIRRNYDSLLSSARSHLPNANIHGVLVQRMAPAGIEVIVSIRHDVLFGPMLMLGLGGIQVEVLRDVALAPVPLSKDDAYRALNQLRGRKLFDGVRGAPPADVAALIDLVVRLSHFAAEQSAVPIELELNPVIVHEHGKGVSVVDALLTIATLPTTNPGQQQLQRSPCP